MEAFVHQPVLDGVITPVHLPTTAREYLFTILNENVEGARPCFVFRCHLSPHLVARFTVIKHSLFHEPGLPCCRCPARKCLAPRSPG